MIARSSAGRTAQRALRRQCGAQFSQRRGLAAPASGSFQYQTGEAAGVKHASRDMAGPQTTLAMVAKAGTRYQPLPGLTEALEKFAFRNTHKRSALRIVREAELLGAELQSWHTRESLVIGSKFFRDDLPYFVELLGEVAGQTKFLPWIYHEEVKPLIDLWKKKFLANPTEMAVNSAHGVAFHRGLGIPLYPSSSTYSDYLDVETIEEFAHSAWAKPNIALVANGAEQSELSKWIGEFFQDVQTSGAHKLESPQTKYYGGEERIAHGSGNAMVLAFQGSSSATGSFYKPELSALASLLGGESRVKWSPGFSLLSKAAQEYSNVKISTKSAIYSDAGLLYVTITGPAHEVAGAAGKVIKTVEDIANGKASKEDITKAIAVAKFKELEYGQTINATLELTGQGLIQSGKPYQLDDTAQAIGKVTEDQIKNAAKSLLEYKASVSAVGDLSALPFAEEIGLKV